MYARKSSYSKKHKSRTFKEMEAWGDDISSFDLIIALSPASQRHALEYTRYFSLKIEYWSILDPVILAIQEMLS